MRRAVFVRIALSGFLLLCPLALAGRFEIRYDDGTPETSYYAVSSGDGYGVKFTAPHYPCTLLAGKYFIPSVGDPTTPFQVVILDDGGPGGSPGSVLSTVSFVSADSGDVWVEVELPDTASLVFVDSISFYAAMYWYAPDNPSVGGDLQFSGGDSLSWRFYSGFWYNLGGLVDLMIRAVVSHPDTSPPTLSETTLLGDTTSCGPLTVSSIIVDDWVGVDPTATFLLWRTSTTGWDSVNMAPVGGDTFRGEMATLPEGDSIWYYLRSQDLARNAATAPPHAPDSSFSFLIIAEPPQFSSTTVWPDTDFAGPYPIVTTIWDNGSGLDTTNISLYWRFGEAAWHDTSMAWFGGAQRALGRIPQVPDPAETTTVHYYVEAYDLIGLRGTDPGGAPDESTYHFLYRPPVGVKPRGTGGRTVLAQSLRVFPNPSTGATAVDYSIPEVRHHGSDERQVTIRIFDLAGRLIANLVSELEDPGIHRVFWDGRDEGGREAAPGVYFCRLQASCRSSRKHSDIVTVTKITILR